MAKKHSPRYAKPSNSYVHPSLQSSRPSSGNSSPPPPKTVNERINALRREQANKEAKERRSEGSDVPGTRLPPPNSGVPRPPPGPAAPASWLESSSSRPEKQPKLPNEDDVMPEFCSLATLDNFVENRSPDRSLVHHTLKTFAQNWQELAYYEQYYLAALPAHLKEALLIYLTRYGEPGCLDLKSFKLLWLDENVLERATGSDQVQMLDLTRLLNKKFTLADLEKCMYASRPKPAAPKALDTALDDKGKGKGKMEEPELNVADNWEDEADTTLPSIPPSLGTPRFPLLTRLSLAHPGPHASWPLLLKLSSALHTLTHLSLAYWPIPALTPNTEIGPPSPFHYHRFSQPTSHSACAEATDILRRFSRNTYSLKWLSLEGCTWPDALICRYDEDNGSNYLASPRPEVYWNEYWSQLEYLNISQGWLPDEWPTDEKDIDILRHHFRRLGNWSNSLPKRLMSFLLLVHVAPRLTPRSKLGSWVAREERGVKAILEIQGYRRKGGVRALEVDYGW